MFWGNRQCLLNASGQIHLFSRHRNSTDHQTNPQFKDSLYYRGQGTTMNNTQYSFSNRGTERRERTLVSALWVC